jgi:hypothetical protein
MSVSNNLTPQRTLSSLSIPNTELLLDMLRVTRFVTTQPLRCPILQGVRRTAERIPIGGTTLTRRISNSTVTLPGLSVGRVPGSTPWNALTRPFVPSRVPTLIARVGRFIQA